MMDNITDYAKIKTDMKELWKDTFHDSSRYIDIVFNTYFTPANVFVRYDENRLIASILCVPYEFQILMNKEKRIILKGMYLCGLATHPDYRRRGIMAELMQEAEQAVAGREFDFTFLIPADSHLREYYSRKGYMNASFRKVEREIEANHTVCTTCHLNFYSIRDLFKNEKNELVELLAEWCREKELEEDHPIMLHSETDMIAAMAENENAIFLTDETFDLKYPILAKVAAVAFPEVPEDQEESIKLVGLYKRKETISRPLDKSGNIEILKAVQDSIHKLYPGRILEFILPYNMVPDNEHQEMMVEPYAMVKPLRKNENGIKTENLTFQICLMLD